VLQLRFDLDLTKEPVGGNRARELGLQDLDRNVTLILLVVGQERNRHSPSADLTSNDVPIGERSTETLERVHTA
jgi:hypothetical protein